jgi:elongation factor P hydroxylase
VIVAKGISNSNLVHEVAHYLVASKKRRRMRDFALGSSPDTIRVSAIRQITDTAASNEEKRASVLGIMIERELGMQWRSTHRNHSWGDDPLEFECLENRITRSARWRRLRPLLTAARVGVL